MKTLRASHMNVSKLTYIKRKQLFRGVSLEEIEVMRYVEIATNSGS